MPEQCISQCAVFVQAGDFVDRGSWSAEIILTLFAYKAMFPQHVHLARGNHESRGMNKVYGFDGEVSSSPFLMCICHAHLLRCIGTTSSSTTEDFCLMPVLQATQCSSLHHNLMFKQALVRTATLGSYSKRLMLLH